MSATTLAGYDGIDWAKDTFEEMAQEPSISMSDIDAAEVQAHVENESADSIVLDVDGEEIPAESVGAGRRARIARNALRADRSGDDMGLLDAVLDMIDILNDHTPAEYDRDYWDDLKESDIQSAFRQLGQQSAGGGQAGE